MWKQAYLDYLWPEKTDEKVFVNLDYLPEFLDSFKLLPNSNGRIYLFSEKEKFQNLRSWLFFEKNSKRTFFVGLWDTEYQEMFTNLETLKRYSSDYNTIILLRYIYLSKYNSTWKIISHKDDYKERKMVEKVGDYIYSDYDNGNSFGIIQHYVSSSISKLFQKLLKIGNIVEYYPQAGNIFQNELKIMESKIVSFDDQNTILCENGNFFKAKEFLFYFFIRENIEIVNALKGTTLSNNEKIQEESEEEEEEETIPLLGLRKRKN